MRLVQNDEIRAHLLALPERVKHLIAVDFRRPDDERRVPVFLAVAG
jgi:hypothetical protein